VTLASLIPLLLKASITLSVLAIGLKATPPDLRLPLLVSKPHVAVLGVSPGKAYFRQSRE